MAASPLVQFRLPPSLHRLLCERAAHADLKPGQFARALIVQALSIEAQRGLEESLEALREALVSKLEAIEVDLEEFLADLEHGLAGGHGDRQSEIAS